ncbi:MAG: glycosyltransferase family 2 protein [Taibaiella sp.]|nr:glycosyltransferase family 2 protein [Taibaiella sp.]
MKKNIHKISSPGEPLLVTIAKLGLFLFTRPGLFFLKKKAKQILIEAKILREHRLTYHNWIKQQKAYDVVKGEDETIIKNLSYQPKISVVIIFKESVEPYLQDAIASAYSQVYTNYELLTGVPAALESEVQWFAEQFGFNAGVLKIIPIKDNVASVNAVNMAASMASGDYILVLDPEYKLTRNCLSEFVRHLNEFPDDNVVYCDSDIINDIEGYEQPFFKPGWSPDGIMSRNYIGNTVLIRLSFLKQVHFFDDRYLYEYVYDVLLKAGERDNRVGHVANVLVHSRDLNKLHSGEAALVVAAALKRRNTPGQVEAATAGSDFNVVYRLPEQEEMVSIIIPTKDNTALLKTTIDSLIKLTEYKNYEIVLLDNNSSSIEFQNFVKEYTNLHPVIFRCVEAKFSFNFARLMNLGAALSRGRYLLMLNNDVEIISKDWLSIMVGYAQRQQTGAVGAQLLFPGGTVQHAGIVLGVGEASAHAFMNFKQGDQVHFNYLNVVNNYSAITAACLLVRKDIFDEVEGMDENLVVEYNDIDFCLKLIQKGYFNVYLPMVVLYHYESATRGHPFKSSASWKRHEKDLATFRIKWDSYIQRDPFYNQNLSNEYTDFRQKNRMKA